MPILAILYGCEFDIFFSFNRNFCITITGTNGKSTTCQLLYEVLLKQKFDVRLAGNIGKPILSVKNIKKKTIFVIEASSYQLEYSKLFKSNCVIFKHSPRCIISKIVLKKFEFQYSDKCGIDKFFLINVIKEREISNQISTLFQLNHESPQLLLVKNKSLIYSASHSDINFKDLL